MPDEKTNHATRFRKIASLYPRRVADAYRGDLARAAADSDAQVAWTVSEWELRNGLEPIDWIAAGESQGKFDPLTGSSVH